MLGCLFGGLAVGVFLCHITADIIKLVVKSFGGCGQRCCFFGLCGFICLVFCGFILSSFIGFGFGCLVLSGLISFGIAFCFGRFIFCGLISFGFGIAFFVGVVFANSVIQFLALQLFNGIYVAIIACLGLMLAQDLMKHEMGMATTLFNGAQQISMLIGNLTVGLVAQFFSYHAVYFVCVAVTVVALVLLWFVREKTPAPSIVGEACIATS